MIIGKNLGFDLEQSRALCTQLNQYKEKKPPFDFPFGYEFEEAINWWNVIETKPLPNSLPLVALHLFAICPNSASCERGFSNLGWLTNKRRLQLGTETLESMCKMITYWKSNPKKKLGFFGKKTKNKAQLSDTELNLAIFNALAEPEEDADEEIDIQEDNFQTVRRTVHDEIIPNNTVTVLIEDICIEKTINLSDELILNDIGEIPIDVDNLESEDENVLLPNDDNNISGKNVLDYDINDVFNEFINNN